jgi:RNA polymerase sigma-70 factor (ECF subfamily)
VADPISQFAVSLVPLAHPIPAVKLDAANGLAQTRTIDDERPLVEQLRRGERAALEQLIAEHHPAIRRLVGRLSGWSNETDDLVQDVFVRAMSSASRFRGDSRIATWLTRIAINVCRGHHRKRMLRRALWQRWTRRRPAEAVDDPSQTAQDLERARRVNQAFRQLRPGEREVIVLHYLEAMEIEKVAATLGISRGAVEVRLHRARKRLGKLLQGMIDQTSE